MKQYSVSKFIHMDDDASHKQQLNPVSIDTVIDQKVSMLYDFCILAKTKKDQHTEARLRNFLSHYTTEVQIDNIMHDIITGKNTVQKLLEVRK